MVTYRRSGLECADIGSGKNPHKEITRKSIVKAAAGM